jgi:hypothetical protein
MASDLGSEVEALLATAAPRHQVFAAFAASIARRTPPTVVVFEDGHWADEATLDLLRYVGRRTPRIRALIVVTWRDDEVGADHPAPRARELPSADHRVHLGGRCRSTRSRARPKRPPIQRPRPRSRRRPSPATGSPRRAPSA